LPTENALSEQPDCIGQTRRWFAEELRHTARYPVRLAS
jgi:hypothetical protein